MAAAPQKKTFSQKISKPAITRRNASFLRSPRLLWFALALLLFGLFTLLAHRQAPRPDPFQPVQAFSWDWWQYPLERNAFKRLPVITSHLNDVFALPNSEKVWAVGDDGMIVHSEDGGETWLQQEVDWKEADSQFTQASLKEEQRQIQPDSASDPKQRTVFIDDQVGTLQSGEGMFGLAQAFKTAGVASLWKDRNSFKSIFFIDEDNGWIVGSAGTILNTTNGGAKWQTQESRTTSDFYSVHFVNATTGWAVGDDGTILSTNNGGATWQAQTSGTTSSIMSVHFVNATTGWAVGDDGTILSTNNGGATWQAQTSGISSLLNFVHFVNATTGWAVGGSGTILMTNNGGATWQAQTSGTTSSIMSVHFVNATTGWAVCGDEYRSEVTILVTKNGGTTWQEQVSGTRSWLLSVHFVNATTGWVVGEHGTILTTRDSGATWQAQASGRKSELESIHFVNAMTGWAVGDGGTILTTRDSGATWQAQASVTRSWLHAVHFVDAMTGWAVGGYFPLEVMILVTSNGGVTWKTQTSGTMGPLNAVHFINPTTGWAVGVTLLNETTILVTNNGGATWQAQTSGISSSLNSVHFVNATTGWAVGDDGTILSTNNGGATWQAQTSGISSSLNSVHFVNATTGWAVGSGGTILVTSNGGATWQVQTSGTTNGFNSVHFVNATTGWAVGDKGTILATNNGGTTWQAQTSRTESWLSHVFFVSAATGWAVGGYGTILSTKDGGQTWNPIKYSRSFAPWYYLTWFFIAPLLYLAFRKPKPIEAEQKTVADMLVSDRPIAAGDPDPLEFNSIARGLSRFLRNENTQPPLTIAITGEWGSGKSSLMNLLKADLERYGFRPVWFNAWHHQKEEHLLAALLQNIRKQAVPSLWHRGGLVFRSRLLWERTRRYWALALLLLALFSFAVGYFVVDHPNRMHQAWEQAGEIEKDLFAFLFSKTAPDSASSPQNAERVESAKDEKEKRVSFFTLLLSTLGSLFVLWRWLRAFGVDPASLMASISDKARLRDLKAQMGFRHDFAREFSEVTVALNPRTMLILIDDLDRCRPENVLEVLEAVNFLVSSGDCFVVMGLDLTRVERCVGLGFKDVAEELVDDPAQEANKDVGKSRREKFARQYLEKLINIEVPVPQPQAQQSQYLIVPPEPIAPRPLTWWQNLFQVSAPIVRKVAPVLLVAGVLIGSTWFSVKYFSPQREEPSATTAAPATTQSPTASNQPTPSTPITSSPRRDTPADSARGSGELIQPQKEPASFAFVYIALAIMIGLGIWRLSIPTDLVVKDSPEFIDALKIWHPLLIAKRNTPRSVKRFVNRVRYFAMRQSSETEEKSVWQKLAVWAGFKQKEEAKQVEAVPESILVALSAIHHYEPELLDKVDEMADGAHIAVEVKAVALRQAIRDHIEKFGNWPPSDEDKALLVKISAGVQVN